MGKTKVVPVPKGLAAEGKSLWQSVTVELSDAGLELDARERRWLFDAACEADLIGTLAAGMVGQPLLVEGSQHQQVINPLVSELRQHREACGRILARLKLTDPDAGEGSGHRYDSTSAREAAYSRWRAK